MEAKAELARFFHQGIQSDSSVEKIVAESKTMSGTGKENVRKEAVQRIKRLRNSTQAILKGVIVLGDCYTKGTEVRVTVGVKQETINAAEGLASSMNASIQNQSAGSATTSSGSGNSAKTGGAAEKQPLTNVDEYSNTKNITKF